MVIVWLHMRNLTSHEFKIFREGKLFGYWGALILATSIDLWDLEISRKLGSCTFDFLSIHTNFEDLTSLHFTLNMRYFHISPCLYIWKLKLCKIYPFYDEWYVWQYGIFMCLSNDCAMDISYITFKLHWTVRRNI